MQIQCTTVGDCPEGFSCVEELGLCVDDQAGDNEAPAIASSSLTPAVAADGQLIQVVFTTNKPLGVLPSMEASINGSTITVSLQSGVVPGEGPFAYELNAAETLGSGELLFATRLVDRVGNATNRDVGSVLLDFDAPVISGVSWGSPVARTTILDDEVVQAIADIDDETVSASLLLSGDATALATIPMRIDDGIADASVALRDYATSPFSTLVAEVVARDAAGNSFSASLPSLTFDRIAPLVVIDSAPGSSSTDLNPIIEFSNSTDDIAEYRCSFDNANIDDCASPLALSDLALGSHRFEVYGVDAAGNEQAAPAVHTWTVERRWASVAVGYEHSCGIATDSSLWCWGDQATGAVGSGSGVVRPTRIETPSEWSHVAAGGNSSCGVSVDGELWCWGADDQGQLGLGSVATPGALRSSPTRVGAASDWLSVDVGISSACGIRGSVGAGSLWCWGALVGVTVPTQVATDTDWTRISVGEGHACGLRSGTPVEAYCWGQGRDGQLGILGGTIGEALPAEAVDRTGVSGGWTDIDVGEVHSCAVTDSGELWCWGADQDGQLGDGPSGGSTQDTPVRVGTDTDWTQVALDGRTSCAKKSGAVHCWGANPYGGLDPATVGGGTEAPIATTGVTASAAPMAVSFGHGCSVTNDGGIECWGYNSGGQLGVGGPLVLDGELHQIGNDTDWLQVTAGHEHSCAVKNNGSLWCWGQNDDYEFGDGTRDPQQEPTQIVQFTDWLRVEAGDDYTCGIRSLGNNSVWCWGDNTYGQTEAGAGVEQSPTPARIGSAGSWTNELATGDRHACAIWGGSDDQLWCWGENAGGNVGCGACSGTQFNQVRVGTATDWLSVSLGRLHSCGIRFDSGNQRAYCWGFSAKGESGRFTSNISSPELVDDDGSVGMTGWTSIAAGDQFTCASRSDGIHCWGSEPLAGGVFGGVETEFPQQVYPGGVRGEVAAGSDHACVIRESDSGRFCWGDNSAGQLGTFDNSAWASLSTGHRHSCGVTNLGELYCWGDNDAGQIGIGGTWLGVQDVPLMQSN